MKVIYVIKKEGNEAKWQVLIAYHSIGSIYHRLLHPWLSVCSWFAIF